MIGERGGENTSDVSLTHHCNRRVVFDGRDVVGKPKIPRFILLDSPIAV